ncbi:MAG: ComEA family DNA-binding protein [Candidatus Woesearchaeota archaeon]
MLEDVLSRRIINARPFHSIDEIKDVKGIGAKTFEKIRGEITVD